MLLAMTTPLAKAQRYVVERGLFGTTFRMTLCAADSATAYRARDAVYARMDSLNGVMSDYLDGSEINRLSAQSGTGAWVPVSADLFAVLKHALRIAQQSGGRYDPTIGPLSQRWRRAVRRGEFPTATQRRRARRAVGWRYVHLDSIRRAVRLARPGMKLDLGGIGQGYAIDVAGQQLRALGISQFLLDLGGDILAGDAPPDQPAGWRIALDSTTVAPLVNAAVTTSGDTYRYLLHRGRRYSHVMNPRSGLGLRHGVRATVLAPDGVRADALTKVFSVAGLRRSKRLVRRWPGVSVWLTERRGGSLRRAHYVSP